MFRILFFSGLVIALSGCMQVAEFFRDHIVTSPGMTKAVNKIEYRYLGVVGPSRLWLKNDYHLEARLPFELVGFPTRVMWDDLNLTPKMGEELEQLAIHKLKDYFGSQRNIIVITLKLVDRYGKSKRYFLDAQAPHQPITVAEYMVEQGFYWVDQDLAKLSDKKYLLKLEEKAQRSRLGVWQHATAYNPNWRD